jgi:hypothetical protein
METADRRLRDGSGQQWQDRRVDAELIERGEGVEEEGGLRRQKIRRRPLTAGEAENKPGLSSTMLTFVRKKGTGGAGWVGGKRNKPTVHFPLRDGIAGNFLRLRSTQRSEIWGMPRFHFTRWESAAFPNLGV